jgi:hypothetical protein
MRLNVEISRDTGREMPRAFDLRGRRIEVVEVIDQWFGDDYRYCKIEGNDGAIYILRVVEHCSDWSLTFFQVAPKMKNHH